MQAKRAVGCGRLIWLIPFAVAVAIYPVKRASQVLFDSIMPVVLAACVACMVRRAAAGHHRGTAHDPGVTRGPAPATTPAPTPSTRQD